MADSGGSDPKGRWLTGIVVAIIAGIFVPIVIALINHHGSSGNTSQSASTPPVDTRSANTQAANTSSGSPVVPGAPISVEATPPQYKLAYSRANLLFSGIPGNHGTGSCGAGAYLSISVPSVNAPGVAPPGGGNNDILFESPCDMKHIQVFAEGDAKASLTGSDNPESCQKAVISAPVSPYNGGLLSLGGSVCVVSSDGNYVAYLKWVGLTGDYSAKVVINGWTR